ncbi:hypothetical protein HN873_015876, partial [Arachis hypogaea]
MEVNQRRVFASQNHRCCCHHPLARDYYLGLELHDELEFIERTAANKQQLQKLSDMYYTLQLLTALLTNSSQRLQEAILNIPRGITRLMDMLMDREDIQKIVIFEGAFEKILSIIRGEGNSDGGVVVQKVKFVDINFKAERKCFLFYSTE